ncbi:MAG: hypothetical protein KJO64_02810, partial [Bacteroidia bacterium]|nr:hypothetical protein [Bacteroidia bacterium]
MKILFKHTITLSITVFIICQLCTSSFAQVNLDLLDCTDTTFCNPKLIGMPRSKALLFNYEGVRDFRFTMKSENSGIPDNQSEVRQNRRIKFKFKVPLIHKPNYKVLVGFKYYEEKFNFDDFSAGYHPIETELEDKSLKSIGGAVYIIKP